MGVIQRREREKVEMRQRIVDAAINMYLEEGYDKLSLRGIAQRIEYAPGTIYLYFKDKDELFHAMHEWAFERLFEKFNETTAIADPLDRLREIGYVYMKFAFDNPELYDLMFILNEPMCAHKDELNVWKCGEKAYEFLRDTVKVCFERRLLRGDNVEMITFSMWSAVHGMVSLKLRNRLNIYDKIDMPVGFDKEKLIEASVEMLFKLFIS
jgi:AcrR family transcriptional regulator